MRSGNINLSIGRLRNAGINGNDWSSLAASKIWGNAGQGAYYLKLNASEVNPSRGPTERWNGLPLRWLGVRGSVRSCITGKCFVL